MAVAQASMPAPSSYCGAKPERDRLAAALRLLAPLAPFQGRPAAHTREMEDASRQAGCPVLIVGTYRKQACLAACLGGGPASIRAHALVADTAPGHTAQPVHARRVDLAAPTARSAQESSKSFGPGTGARIRA